MGVVISYFNNSGLSSEPDPVTGLTPKEISFVQNSWAPIKKDLLNTGVELFMIFFKNYPEYQKFFPFRNVPYDELRTNEKLQAHATNVVYAICAIVDNLHNTPILVNLLINSGKSHAKRKIAPKAYWDLKATIMELLQNAIGSKFTKDISDAWDKTLTVAFNVILNEFADAKSSNEETS